MDESSTKLTVYFDDPFWVGVFERMEDGTKVTFGAEPKGYEVWEFVLRHFYALKLTLILPTDLLDSYVRVSGLTKQDYITRRLLRRDVVVQGDPRAYKALRDELTAVLAEHNPPKKNWKDLLRNTLQNEESK